MSTTRDANSADEQFRAFVDGLVRSVGLLCNRGSCFLAVPPTARGEGEVDVEGKGGGGGREEGF